MDEFDPIVVVRTVVLTVLEVVAFLEDEVTSALDADDYWLEYPLERDEVCEAEVVI